MKKLLLIPLMLCALPTLAVPQNPEYRVSLKYRSDATIVEFTPKGRPDLDCFIASSGNGIGITCVPKPRESTRKNLNYSL